MNKEKALELHANGKLSDSKLAEILNGFRICECNAGTLTVSGTFGHWEADCEPYKNGKQEDAREEHQTIIDGIEFYLTANICLGCNKISFYSEDGILVGEHKNEN